MNERVMKTQALGGELGCKYKQALSVEKTELPVNADMMMEGVRMGAFQRAAAPSSKAGCFCSVR